MMGRQLVIIADDLTGAADTAAPFASAGFATAIPLAGSRPQRATVVAYSTEGRDLTGPEAARRVRDAIDCEQRGGPPSTWYKKIDSALRGHPALEIAIAMDAIGADRVLIAPAIPSEGRTTVRGAVNLHGIPLHETPLGRGRTTSSVADGFRELHPAPVTLIGLEDVRGTTVELAELMNGSEPALYIADAETNEDLDRLAAAAISARIPLFAGSAGLARSLAGVLTPPSNTASRVEAEPRALPVLIVAGSRHAVCESQIETAFGHGAARIQLPRLDRPLTTGEMASTSQRVATSLAQGCPVIVTTAGMERAGIGGDLIADQLACIATNPQVTDLVGGMVLTGGDVAAAVCRRLVAHTLWLGGEVLPAIPWAIIEGGRLPGLPIVTKAGSFGPSDALLRSIEFLEILVDHSRE